MRLYLLPLYSACVTFLSLGIVIKLFKRQLFDHLDVKALLSAFSKGDERLHQKLDEKLDRLVLVFKQQIPMASTFLTGRLLEGLKSQARGELVKLIPEIKEAFELQLEEPAFKEKILKSAPLTSLINKILLLASCFSLLLSIFVVIILLLAGGS